MAASPEPRLNIGAQPIDMRHRPLLWQAAAVFFGTAFLALSSYIEVPMVPVPVTMQTFAITLIGAVYGWRLGAVTVLAWLAEAAIGLPVLAGGASGIAHFMGPTGGYLASFPIIAALTGLLAERGWNGKRPVLAFAAMLLANLLCLAIGATWLATLIGAQKAIAAGVTPFVIGAVLKSALGAMVLRLMTKGKLLSHE